MRSLTHHVARGQKALQMHGFPVNSLMTQPPKTHAKKGSGNIVYEVSQTLECGATNQIAINVQSAQFIMKIIFTKNAPYGGARVQKGSIIATSSMQKTSSQSSDHLSPYRIAGNFLGINFREK